MHPILLKSLNLVVYILFICTATFTLITTKSFPGSSDNNNVTNAQNSSSSYTYITPATYTFGILFLIYFLIAVFVIYQWFVKAETDENYDIVVDGVSYYFIIVIIFAIAWCILWLFKLYLIAAIIHLFLFVAIAYICLTIDLYYESKGFFDNLLIRKPFSMWAGFALYTTILSFWIAIPALDTVFLSVIALIILIIVGLFVVDYYPFKDSSFSIAILWVLIGISCYQVKVIPVFTVTVLGSGLITGGILKSIFDWYDEQQNSLAMLN